MILSALVAVAVCATLASSQKGISPASCYSSRGCYGTVVERSTGAEETNCCLEGGLSFSDNTSCCECFSTRGFEGEGNKLLMGFFGNFQPSPFFEINKARIFVNSVQSPSEAFMLNVSGTVSNNTTPTEVEMDADQVAIVNDGIRDRAISIQSLSNNSLSVVGYAEEFTSSDTWKVLPCVYLPVVSYEYYAISVPVARIPVEEDYVYEAEEFQPPVGNSAIVVITSESNTEMTITLTQNISITAQDLLQQVPQGVFQAMVPVTIRLPNAARSLYIASANDLTGSRITSNKPIAFISGHECGTIPNNFEYCDQLVEQVPPTATWGKSFITCPIAMRSAFDLFKVLASRDDTIVEVSCTGGRPFQTLLLQKGGFGNVNVSSSTFCYISSNQPVLVVQYSVVSSVDRVNLGDPFMVIIPPIEQYRSSYNLNTFLSSQSRLRNFEDNFINILIPDGVDPNGIRLNGSSVQAQFTSIPCNSRLGPQSPTCGSAAQVSIPHGQFILSHVDSSSVFNAIVYLLSYRVGTGYFAGMAQNPIGLPRISFSGDSFQAFENQSSVSIRITRAGDLTDGGSVQIRTLQLSALFIEDFEEVDALVEFSPNQEDIVVSISLTDDVFPEEAEQFEVVLEASPGVYIDSPARAVVTILNDDPELPVMNVSFADVNIGVAEGFGVVSFMLQKTAGAVGPVSVQIITMDQTATGEDYVGINETITFEIEDRELIVQTFILDDALVEVIEEFVAFLFPIAGVFPVAVQNSRATVSITDNDVAIIGFSQCQYSFEEINEQTIMVEILQGMLDTSVQVMLVSADETAQGGSDYLEVMEVLSFDSDVISHEQSVTIMADALVEREESFTMRLQLVNTSANVKVLQDEVTVTIIDRDIAVIELQAAGQVVREGTGSARVVVGVSSGQLTEPVTVRILTANINATAGEDYDATNLTLTLSGTSSEEHLIGVISDNTVESGGDESFVVIISIEGGTMDGRIRLGSSSMEIRIEDSDVNVPSIGFQERGYTFCESDGTVNILVESNDIQEPLSMDYLYLSGTAEESVDVAVVRGRLTFVQGSRLATIAISITGDSIAERDESFVVGLRALNGTTILDSTEVTIRDDDVIEVSYEESSYSVSEGGQVIVMIGKFGETGETVCVTFNTIGITAMEIVDFIPVSSTICFPPLSTEQEVTVNIAADDISESAEVFLLQLTTTETNVRVNLGQTSIATVTIAEDQVISSSTPEMFQCLSTANTISCTWTQPNPDRVSNYLLTWRYTGPCETDSQSFLLDKEARRHILENLEEGGRYNVALTPMNSLGSGVAASVEVITESAVPSGVPLSVRTTVLSIDSARIHWRAPNCLDANGVIEQYNVTYSPSDTGIRISTLTSDTMLTVTGLRGGLEYSFQVAASNAAGMGPFSEPIILIVDEDICASGGANCDSNAECISTRGSFICICNLGYSGDGVTCRDTDECSNGFNNCDCNADCLNTIGSFTCTCREGFIGNGINCTDIQPLTVNFDRREYFVIEEDTVVLTIALSRAAEEEITVQISTTDITAQGFTDYTPISRMLTFSTGATRSNVSLVTIGGVAVAELNETLMVSLSNPSDGLTLGEISTATTTIIDNDDLFVNFDPSTYFVIEGGTVGLVVTLSLPASYSVSVTVNTEDGLSTAPDDFIGIRTNVTFPPGQTQSLLPVNTINDSILEIEEDFSAFLSNPSSNLMLGTTDTALIFVADDDVLRIGFAPVVYFVGEESGQVILTISIVNSNLSRGQLLELSVFTLDETATAPNDYSPAVSFVTFTSQIHSQNVSVNIIDDTLLENTESFTVQLELDFSDAPDDSIVFTNRTARVNIIDNDADAVAFQLSPVNVTEGVNQMAITTLSVARGELGRTVNVVVSAIAGSAEVNFDFTALQSFIPLSPTLNSVTYGVNIVDDDIFEDPEMLTISAEFNDLVDFSPISVPITVFDNDNVSINFSQLSYTIIENSGAVNISVVINGRISRPIEILIETQSNFSATPDTDFVSISRTVTFTPSINSQQIIDVPITIINDNNDEDSESFNCTARLLEENVLIIFTQNLASVLIVDDDDIQIGFEQTDYTVSENDGSVEVAIGILSGRTERQIILLFIRTVDGTAVAPDDYLEINGSLALDPQKTRVSQVVNIQPDSEAEDDEFFTMVLSTPADSVTISPVTATITILGSQVCETGDLRLQDGSNQFSGRVEICQDGVWGTICDNMWDDLDAAVVCRQLGFSDQGAQALFRFFDLYPPAEDEVEIFLDELQCIGTEARLEDCQSDPNTEDCLHFLQDAGVACQPLVEQ